MPIQTQKGRVIEMAICEPTASAENGGLLRRARSKCTASLKAAFPKGARDHTGFVVT